MRYESRGSPRRGHPDSATDTLARGLGLFSIALGLAEIAAPRRLAQALGMDGQETLVAAYGVREIATGIGILASADPTPWVWGRVGGDALDIATLATAFGKENPKNGNVAIALGAVLGVTVLDVLCATTLSREDVYPLPPLRDYSDLPRGIEAARGAARDFEVPEDMRIPEAMRPYATA